MKVSPPIAKWISDLQTVGVEGVQIHSQVFLTRLFVVPKNDWDKGRLIIDLSHLNRLIPYQRFRMVSVAQGRLHLQQNTWLKALDLTDTYWHVLVAASAVNSHSRQGQ